MGVGISIKFDINRWLERRKQERIERLKALCPHTYFEMSDAGILACSYFRQLAGTIDWQCGRCSFRTIDMLAPKRIQSYWGEHLEDWVKQENKFIKLFNQIYKVWDD